MDGRAPPFRYRLAALLRQREWERDAMQGELARLRVAVSECARRHDEVLLQIEQGRSRMRDLYRPDQAIALETRQRLEAYLSERHVKAEEQRVQLAQVERLRDSVLQRLEAARTAVRVLEKHRDRARSGVEMLLRRELLAQMDERWLLRRRGGLLED